MQVELGDLVNAAMIAARRPGLSASKVRTWHTRNTHGFRELALDTEMSPPIYLWSEVEPVLDAAGV